MSTNARDLAVGNGEEARNAPMILIQGDLSGKPRVAPEKPLWKILDSELRWAFFGGMREASAYLLIFFHSRQLLSHQSHLGIYKEPTLCLHPLTSQQPVMLESLQTDSSKAYWPPVCAAFFSIQPGDLPIRSPRSSAGDSKST